MPAAVLDYWFGADRADALRNPARARLWWRKDPVTDADIRARFEPLVVQVLAGECEGWARTPSGLLALVILADQFTRNIYRDTPRAFAGDPFALAWCQRALAAGTDRSLHPLERLFLYLPLEHSEVLADQEDCVTLMATLVDGAAEPAARALLADALDYARRHREVIRRFGRFPHRNAMLGRASTAEEVAFLKTPGSSF
ncbi:MAG: DUF924 domain-containing protein [Gammaproteobacteria bacterium]|nr:DUF924 domain-containing protein [Gammaproteobacteria bacterium]